VESPAVLNASVTPTTTAVDPTNGHQVAFGKSRRLLIRINSTFAGAKTFTFKAGVHGKSGQGDLIVSLNAVVGIIVVESARFKQADGNLYIDVAAAATGTVEAYRMPAVA
jgi:hypothetical protein